MARAPDQRRPGECAVADVGLQYAPECPALQVRDLDVPDESDAGSVSAQTGAKLDVLDAGPRVAWVEPARGQETFAPDGAAAGPERRRSFAAVLMNVVVEQVA